MEKMLELAGALILDENKRLLLIHRNTENRVQWELPGGKIEQGEEPNQTVIRELMEELNIKVKIEKYLGNKESVEDGIILKYHWFKCIPLNENDNPKLMEDKFDKIKYFTKQELNDCTELSANMAVLKDTIDINNI